jgi:hypothetical protein
VSDTEFASLPAGQLFYKMTFDLTSRRWYIAMLPQECEERVMTDDGEVVANIGFIGDLPIVLGLEINDPKKFSIIQDWIEEATEKAMRVLNVTREDRFEDDHFKGLMISE